MEMRVFVNEATVTVRESNVEENQKESLFRMAYGDESLCEKSNCDGKESNIEENQKKNKKL